MPWEYFDGDGLKSYDQVIVHIGKIYVPTLQMYVLFSFPPNFPLFFSILNKQSAIFAVESDRLIMFYLVVVYVVWAGLFVLVSSNSDQAITSE